MNYQNFFNDYQNYPNSDLTTINLDFILNELKNNDSIALEIKKDLEELQKISITENKLKERLKKEIANYDETIKNYIKDNCYSTLIQSKNYTNNQFDALKIYIDSKDLENYNNLKSYSDFNDEKLKKQIDDFKADNLQMINPITGELEDTRDVINSIVSTLMKTDSMTVEKFDSLELSVDEFDKMSLSAFDIDFYGNQKIKKVS
ncbi:MAG: hypothetical protein N4R94_06030 [Lactobacillus iners]|nr:hypothetical protein [Lactobacillus iners]